MGVDGGSGRLEMLHVSSNTSVEHPTSSPTIKVATISSLIFGTTPSNYPQKFERCPSISCTRLNTNLVLLDESQYAVIHCSLDKSRQTSHTQSLIQCFRGSIVKVPPSYFCWPCHWQTATAIVSCTSLLYSRWEEMCLVPTGRGVLSSVLMLVQCVYCGKCVVWHSTL